MPSRRGDVVLVLFPDSNLRTAKRARTTGDNIAMSRSCQHPDAKHDDAQQQLDPLLSFACRADSFSFHSEIRHALPALYPVCA